MENFNPTNIEQLEIKLILENKVLKSAYEDVLKERLKINKKNAKMELINIKLLDNDEEKVENEIEPEEF